MDVANDLTGLTYGVDTNDDTSIPGGLPVTGGFQDVASPDYSVLDGNPDSGVGAPLGNFNPWHSALPWLAGMVVLFVVLNSKED